MTQIMFPLDKAHEALDEFLNDREASGALTERWLAGKDGEPVAYLVDAAAYDEMSNGHHHWLEAQEIREEAATAGAGYKPWRHSPLATQDRLLPIEPLQDPLARGMFRKPYGELDEDQRNAIMGTAIWCVLRVTLDPDGQGAVPILAVGHDGDEPGSGLRWQLGFVTEVPGLFLRVTGNGFFGEEWGIVTGSGYRLAGGWYSRDEAGSAAAALGRVLPNTDWMRLTPGAFTPRAKEAIAAVIRKYRFLADDSEPDPEPMTDEVPPAEGKVLETVPGEEPAP